MDGLKPNRYHIREYGDGTRYIEVPLSFPIVFSEQDLHSDRWSSTKEALIRNVMELVEHIIDTAEKELNGQIN